MFRIFKISLIVISICLTGMNINAQAKADTLLERLNQALESAQKTKDRELLAKSYYALAIYEDENFDQSGNAQRYFLNAREYYNILNDNLMVSTIDKSIGELYMKSGFFQEAEEAFKKSLDYFTEVKDLRSQTFLYFELSKLYNMKGDTEQELRYLNKATGLNSKLQDTSLQIEFMLRKIKSYELINEVDSSIIMSLEAVKLSNTIEDKTLLSKSLFQLGSINYKNGDFEKAEKYYRSAEDFSSKKPYNDHRKNIYQNLSGLYNELEDYKNAFYYEQRYAAINDSILNKNRIESINNNAIKYETKERKREIALLEVEKKVAEQKNTQQKNAMYILTAGLLMLLALVYYIINFYRTRIKAEQIITGQKQEISQQKIRELEDNIKISSMQSMLEGQEIERERISKDLHDSLGGLLSTIKLQFDSVQAKMKPIKDVAEYKSANKMLDTAVEEVRAISQNLQPGSLMKLGLVPALKDLFNRFDGDTYPEVDFQHYNMPENIPNMVSLTIYRVIQELLNNTVKHANANEILIQINTENEELVIQFEDDGKGYDEKNVKKKGMGLENIKSRINYLKGTLSINTKPGEGTSTLIHVKYK